MDSSPNKAFGRPWCSLVRPSDRSEQSSNDRREAWASKPIKITKIINTCKGVIPKMKVLPC